jgi:hypothetical protein
MKKLFLVIAACGLLASCLSTKQISGSYTPANHVESELSYNEVWSRIIDFFAVNGITISVMDKSSGLIVAGKMDFTGRGTVEGSDGQLLNKSAYIVTERIRMNGVEITPNDRGWTLTGDWNVRIKPSGDKTSINVNLNNIYSNSPFGRTNAKSTGFFENQLIEILK